jgi:hypothetical protein
MSNSFTFTQSTTFTITHAKYLASKVATDLKRIQRFYGEPDDSRIARLEEEIALFLKYGYLRKVTYGFKKNGNWIEPTLVYTSEELGCESNDDPGRIRPGKDVSGASFYSYLEYSHKWSSLGESDKEAFEKQLPISRSAAMAPGISGYLENDRTYSSGGRSLSRASVRSC